MKPIVNINGTSRESLIAQRMDVYNVLYALEKALFQMAPHGRDYLGNIDAFEEDRKVHMDRLKTIKELQDDIMGEALNIRND